MWLSSPAVLVHVLHIHTQSANVLAEGEYRSEGVVINKYALIKSHHRSRSSETTNYNGGSRSVFLHSLFPFQFLSYNNIPSVRNKDSPG